MTNDLSRRNPTAVIVPITTIILSTIAAWAVALYVTKDALYDDTGRGEVIFQDIGYRYFYAIGVYGAESLTRKQRRIYRELLTRILEDIRWLRTNPMYIRSVEQYELLPFVEFALIHEIQGTQSRGENWNFRTAPLMCHLFVDSGSSDSTENAVAGERDGASDPLARLRVEVEDSAKEFCAGVIDLKNLTMSMVQ